MKKEFINICEQNDIDLSEYMDDKHLKASIKED